MPGQPSRRQLLLGMLGGLFGFTGARPAAEPAPQPVPEAANVVVINPGLPVGYINPLAQRTMCCYDAAEGRVFRSSSLVKRTEVVYQARGIQGRKTQPPRA